ncbi:MAG: DUF1616 domain-containing protein [Thermoplasmata archaeon]
MGQEPSGGSFRNALDFLESQNGQRIAISAYAVVATLIGLAFPGGALAFAFGLPLLFFVPGFAVVRLFFWKGTSPETRFVLSLGLSILVVIFLGLFLVLTPIGLESNTTRGSLVVFTLSAVALEAFWLRADRGVEKKAAAPPAKRVVKPAKPDKVVAAMIGTALVVSAISLGLIITAHYPSRTFFAITDENGHVITNTTRTPGTNITFVVHMKNGEDGPREFMMVTKIALNKTTLDPEWHNKSLAKGEEWNVTITLRLNESGTNRIDFDLYIQEEGKAAYFYGNLHMWFWVY